MGLERRVGMAGAKVEGPTASCLWPEQRALAPMQMASGGNGMGVTEKVLSLHLTQDFPAASKPKFLLQLLLRT